MINRTLRNTALSLAVLSASASALAGGTPTSYGVAAPGGNHRPSSANDAYENGAMASGVAGGGIIGAIAGGPPGAIAGMFVGGGLGETAHRREEASKRQAQLAELRARNKRLSHQLEAARAKREGKQAELARLKRRQSQDLLTSSLALDVLFATDSAELTSKGQERVATLAGLLQGAHDTTVTLVGQADRRGTEPYNQKLSEQRARAVRDALVAQGIRPDRLALEAVGEQQADAPADDPDGLARDRRVTIDLDRQAGGGKQVVGTPSR